MITRSACLALLIAALSLPNAVPASAQCLPPERLFSDAVTGLIPDPADHVVVADFNSDGTTDLAIGGSGQRLAIKLGALGILGQVTFSDALYLPVHSTPMGFATGDFNGDHIPDLAIAAMDGDQIEIDLGSGRGAGWTMAQTDSYPTLDQPYSVAVGDVNADGRQDLVVSCFLAGTISVFLGNGDGTFGNRTDYFTGGEPGEVQLADLNKDGLLDVVTTNFARSGVTTLLGNGGSGVEGGLFQDFRIDGASSGYGHSTKLRLGDFNEDGVLDCAVLHDFFRAVVVYEGYIAESGLVYRFFPTTDVIMSPSPGEIALADVDRDGHLDIVGTTQRDVSAGTLSVIFGAGDFTFPRGRSYAGAEQAAGVAVADLNGDAVLDLVAVGHAGTYTIDWGQCPGEAPEITSFSPVAGVVGDTVVVRGMGFKLVTRVRFNGIQTEMLSHSATTIQVLVPEGATSGPITVDGTRGTGTSTSIFRVGERPIVEAALPDGAKPGQTVSVLGRHFSEVQEVNFGSTEPARFEWVSDSLIKAVVDTLSRTGPIRVRTVFGSGMSAFSFPVSSLDTAPKILRVADLPNDQGGRVAVTWTASDLDVVGRGFILGYRVRRKVHGHAPPDEEWIDVATASATGSPSYRSVVRTLGDSTAAGIPYETFVVRALTNDPNARFDAAPDSGYSIDNVPPSTPDSLAVRYELDRFELRWHVGAEPDLDGYAVHRGEYPRFEAGPENQVAFVRDSDVFTDTLGFAGHYFQIVAVDVHGNRSAPAEVEVDAITIPDRFGVVKLGPNPATDRLMLTFALPSTDPVRLEAIDLAGRRVLDDRVRFATPGYHLLEWRATAALPPGVYFLRMRQGPWTLARRFVITR